MNNNETILVTGSQGMVGKSLIRKLKEKGYMKILTPSSKELDLRNQNSVINYFKEENIDYIFHLAAKVGGIAANISSPAEFLYDNIIMGCNLIECAKNNNIKKLLFLGSSCIYPRECSQPMKEEYLLSGKLEPTNEGYALSKICGLKMCEYYNKQYGTNFISLMPPNIYGPNDHFDTEKSHVISALISKFHNAKNNKDSTVTVWGSGIARREFLFVEDLANAMIFFMDKYNAEDIPPFVNIGYGKDISIKELAQMIKEIVSFDGEIYFDKSKPDGMLKKNLDVNISKKLGWESQTSLKSGLEKTYMWYQKNVE